MIKILNLQDIFNKKANHLLILFSTPIDQFAKKFKSHWILSPLPLHEVGLLALLLFCSLLRFSFDFSLVPSLFNLQKNLKKKGV